MALGYLFLVVSLLAGTTKGFCGKKTSGYVRALPDTMLMNTLRMLFCILIGFGFVLFSGGVPTLAVGATAFWISLLSGVCTSLFVVLWVLAVRHGSYVMLDVFLLLGTAVPLLFCSVKYGEPIEWIQWIGLAVLLLATVIMCTYNKTVTRRKLDPVTVLLYLSCGACNGLVQLSQKLFNHECAGTTPAVFNFYTYVFSAVILIACYFITAFFFPAKDENGRRVPMKTGAALLLRRVFWYILVMAVCLFLNSYFSTLAAGYLDAALQFPLQQSASLLLSMLMAAVFFRERINARCVAGVVLAIAGIVVTNVGPTILALLFG